MGFVCVMPDDMAIVDANYAAAAANYARQREAIIQQLNSQTNQSGQEFITQFQANFRENMRQKIQSPDTLREVRYTTIINHIYKAAESLARSIVEDNSGELDSLKGQVESLRREGISDIQTERDQIDKEIDKIITQFAEQMSMNNIFNKYLPQVLSQQNQQLSGAQVLAYCKSIFKQEIYARLQLGDVDRVVKKHPAIILGYIREDALSKAASDAITQFQLESAKAQTVGAAKSAIDVLISLTGGATSMTEEGGLEELLSGLDAFSSFTTEGESPYESDTYLGIQSKSWNFYRTDQWNRLSLGSRAGILSGYKESLGGMEGEHSWHRGVLYLSYNLTEIMGANTVMYATGDSIIWTDQLLQDLTSQWHRYFAFELNSNNALTSHIILAEHYG